jgi:hypothetical protein
VEEMRKIVILLSIMAVGILPLISYAAIQPDTKTTWVGGVVGDETKKLENMSLSEISEKAMREAGISGGFVKYSTEDGGVIFRAYSEYGKSKCRIVHGSVWEGPNLIETMKPKEVCNRDFRFPTPFVPNFR